MVLYFPAHATEQENDKIIYQNEECVLQVHWAYPSPLQVYYDIHKEIQYPFDRLGTANYRGHIATWKIAESKLYLINIARESDDRRTSDNPRRRTLQNIPLNTLFPTQNIKDDAVFADWFTGYLLILVSPYKEWFESPYSDDKFYSLNYKKVIIAKLRNGYVIAETSYDADYYWEIIRKYYNYKAIKNSDKMVLEEYDAYISGFREPCEAREETKVFHTEDDFEVFLTRYFTKKVRIPLTEYCIIKDATIDFSERGAFIDYDLVIAPGSSLLILQVGGSNVPFGSWHRYSRGLVQVLVHMNPFTTEKIIIDEHQPHVKFTNGYGAYKSPKSISGELDIIAMTDTHATLTGIICLTSEHPSTFQEINLENHDIPIYSIREYLTQHKAANSRSSEDVEEIYQDIKAKSE